MRQSAQLRVVCLDDEPDVLRLLQLAVDHEPGFDMVATTTELLEVIDLISEHRPDVLILDQAIKGGALSVGDEARRPVSSSAAVVLAARTLIPDATVVIFTGRQRPVDSAHDDGDVWVQKPHWDSLWPEIRRARCRAAHPSNGSRVWH